MPQNLLDFHLDTYLTGFVTGYGRRQPSVMQRALTRVPVNQSSGKFKRIKRGAWFRDQVEERPLGGTNPIIKFDTDEDTYITREYGLRGRVDDRVIANNNTPIDIQRAYGELLVAQHVLHQDVKFGTDMYKPGVWGTDLTGVASGTPTSSQFLQFDQAGSTPTVVIRKQKRTVQKVTGRILNVAVMGVDVIDALLENASLIGRIQYTQRGILDLQLLASLLGFDEIIPAETNQNTAAEGLTDAMSFVFDSKSILMLYRAPLATTDGTAVTAGAWFPWDGLVPGMNSDGVALLTRRIGEAYSDEYDSRSAWDVKVMAPDLGVFMSAAVG